MSLNASEALKSARDTINLLRAYQAKLPKSPAKKTDSHYTIQGVLLDESDHDQFHTLYLQKVNKYQPGGMNLHYMSPTDRLGLLEVLVELGHDERVDAYMLYLLVNQLCELIPLVKADLATRS